MKKLRLVSEAEAIGEFLRNEYYEPDYHRDRERFEEIVLHPDYTDPEENALRRALLYRRRGHMWRELPLDTEWWHVELEQDDLPLIRVFPRAHWRRISNGSFNIADVVDRIRQHGPRSAGDRVIAKIQQMRYRLKSEEFATSTVLLIGIHESMPVTILEGNHRFSAAMLVSPDVARTRFRVLCGISPRMNESCWYQTNLANLWRYAKHRVANIYDREADVKRLLTTPQAAGGLKHRATNAVAAEKLTETQS